jgi:hypothetical protein
MIECLGACFGDVPEIARDAGKPDAQEIRRLLSRERIVRLCE